MNAMNKNVWLYGIMYIAQQMHQNQNCDYIVNIHFSITEVSISELLTDTILHASHIKMAIIKLTNPHFLLK
jgi:hypothetical protein